MKGKKVICGVLALTLCLACTGSACGSEDDAFRDIETKDEIFSYLNTSTKELWECEDELTLKMTMKVEQDDEAETGEFVYSMDPKEGLMFYTLQSEDGDIKIKLYKENGKNFLYSGIKTVQQIGGETNTYQKDNYASLSDDYAKQLTRFQTFSIYSETEMDSLFREYDYSYSETKAAYESVYAEQLAEEQKTSRNAYANFEMNAEKSSEELSFEFSSQIGKDVFYNMSYGTSAVNITERIVADKDGSLKAFLSTEQSFSGETVNSYSKRLKVTIEMDVEYSFDEEGYKAIETKTPAAVEPGGSEEKDISMKFNVNGCVGKKSTSAYSFIPSYVFADLSQDYVGSGYKVDWFEDEAYTKPFQAATCTNEQFEALQCVYGKVTVDDGWAAVAKDYVTRDDRSDEYKAVFGFLPEADSEEDCIEGKKIADNSAYSLPILGTGYETYIDGEKYDATNNQITLEGGRFYLVQIVETVTDDQFSIFDVIDASTWEV